MPGLALAMPGSFNLNNSGPLYGSLSGACASRLDPDNHVVSFQIIPGPGSCGQQCEYFNENGDPYGSAPLGIQCPAGYIPACGYTCNLQPGVTTPDPYANVGSQLQPPVSADNPASSNPALSPSPNAQRAQAACGDNDPILIGHPINAKTGNKYLQEVDYQGSGPFPLAFVRYYNSGVSVAVPQTNLGAGWRHNYDRQILVEDATHVVVVRPNGQAFEFTLAGGTWSSTVDMVDKLETAGTGWQLITQSDETETYNANGHLTTIANRAGLTQALAYGTSGLLTTVTDPAGRQLNFTYDNKLRISTATDPAGNVIQIAYSPDALSNLTSVSYPGTPSPLRTYFYGLTGSGSIYLYHALTGIQDENNQSFATYSYDTSGRATGSSLGGPSILADPHTLTYNADGTTSDLDATNTTRIYGFQTSLGIARVASISQPCSACGAGASASITYDANAFVSSRTDWNGNVTTYTRNGNDPNGRKDLETSRTEASGSAQARIITTQWHATWRLPTKVAEPKRLTTYQYDANGNLSSLTQQATTDSNGSQGLNPTLAGSPRTWTYTNTYSGTVPGLVVQQVVDGPRPRTEVTDTTTYDFCTATDTGNPPAFRIGDLWKITNALGHLTQITQNDANGRPLAMTDPNGLVTGFTYDARGRLKSVTRGGRLTTYNYDKVGNLTDVIWPDSTQASYGYDAAHRLTTITDQLGDTRNLTLDQLGNITQDQLRDPQGNVVRTQTQTFDNLGRLWKQIDALNNTTVLGYDPQSNLKAVTDPKQQVSTYGYDALNRVVSLTDAMTPTHGVTNVVLDGLDQLTQVSAPNGAQTSYQVDGLGNVTSESSPDRGSTTYTYDEAGNLKTRTDARGIQFQVTFSYDALNRLTSVSYPNSSENVILTYDSGANCGAGAIGRLCGVQDAGGSVNYTYDLFGNITAVARTELTVPYAQSFGYDNLDRLTSQVTPDNKGISAPRDALGRNAGLTTSVAGNGTNVLSQLKWRADNQLASQTFGNHTAQAITYDPAGRFQSSQSAPVPTQVPTLPQWGVLLMGLLLAGLGWRAQRRPRAKGAQMFAFGLLAALLVGISPATVLAQQSRSLGYDANSNITSQSTSVGSSTYGYDPLNRLSSESGPSATQSFTYDANGNRLTDGAGGYSVVANSNRYQSIHGATPQYDPAGNLTDDGHGRSFAYNQAGRLSQVLINSTVVASFVYDYLGRRTRKSTPAGTTVYTYDVQGLLVYESKSDGTPLARYLYRDGVPVAKIDAPNTPDNPLPAERITYLSTDQLGAPRTGTDQSGKLVWRWESDAFGSSAPEEDPDGDGVHTVINLRFPGQYFDKETGLVYNYQRDYDPSTGRYIESDPIGLAGGINTYGYVRGNPLAYSDSSGRCVGPLAALCYYLVIYAEELLFGSVVVAEIAAGVPNPVSSPISAASASARLSQGPVQACSAASEELAAAARRATATVGAGRGPVYGTRVHSAFEAEVNALGRADFSTEVSYLNGQIVPRGTPGSVRLDVVEGPVSNPTSVFDLKTGGAKLTPTRIQDIQRQLPGGANIPVLMVRP